MANAVSKTIVIIVLAIIKRSFRPLGRLSALSWSIYMDDPQYILSNICIALGTLNTHSMKT